MLIILITSFQIVNYAKVDIMSDSEIDSDFESALSRASSEAGNRMFACSVQGCAKFFSKRSRLNVHMLSHTGERPFECDECDASYTRQSHLKRHVDNKHKGIRFPCPSGCPANFFSQEAAKKHDKVAHRQSGPDGGESESVRYKCEKCARTFAKRAQLTKHSALEHGEAANLLPHKCEECGKRFKFPNKLRIHAETRHREDRHRCDLCEINFKAFNELRKHNAELHAVKARPFQCPDCDKSFVGRSGLRNHRKKDHDDVREVFRCPEDGCRQTYFQLRNLNDHVRVIHGGLRHKCEWEACDKMYTSRRKLALHAKNVHGSSTSPVKKSKKRTAAKSMASILSSVELDPRSDKQLIKGRTNRLSAEQIQNEVDANEELRKDFEEVHSHENQVINSEICQKKYCNEGRETDDRGNKLYLKTLKILDGQI